MTILGKATTRDMFKSLRFLFYISALLFVSKPLLGFSLMDRSQKQDITCELLVKLFSKRKSDYLEANLPESPAALVEVLSRSFVPLSNVKIDPLARLRFACAKLVNAALRRIRFRIPVVEDVYFLSMSFRL